MSKLDTTTPHRVVIIGAGFAGLAAAKGLANAPVEVTLIDKRNFHLFQPLLYQVATGALSPANIASPIRSLFKRAGNVAIILGEVVAVDTAACTVSLADGDAYDYDTLVLAPGVVTQYFAHPEWERLAPGLKTVEDAITVRSRVLAAFERAEMSDDPAQRERELTFIVVGGGPTGVEMAGAIAEIARFTLRGEFRRIDPGAARIVLVEAGPTILPMYSEDLRERARRDLRRLGVEVREGVRVTDISPDGVTLATGDQANLTPTVTTVWAAGTQTPAWSRAIAEQLGAELDRGGRIVVLPDLSVPGHPEVFVAGDLANVKDEAGKPLAPLGSVAQQQGRYLAKVIRARAVGGEAHPAFHYVDRGTMATIGRAAAIADLRFARLTGFIGWLAWLFVHLMLLVEYRNRVIVFLTWAWSYVTRNRFARLITRLD